MKEGIIIAIDGFSACGKSTLAKALAKTLNYTYIDTGAMYRAVTYYFLENGVDLADANQIEQALNSIEISFQTIGEKKLTMLNTKNIEKEIREMRVSEFVSPVAEISAVRRFLVAQQQEMGKKKRCILDGRDIGTVVFPNAPLKIFLTADPKERAQRRLQEMIRKGEKVSLEEVMNNLKKRDTIDSSREDSPLRQATDAVVIDNTVLSPEEQLAMVSVLARMRGA